MGTDINNGVANDININKKAFQNYNQQSD
jgi:hypothetical protein